MWALFVVLVDERLGDKVQIFRAKADGPPEAFLLERSDPRFGECIGIGCHNQCFNDVDIDGFEDASNARGNLASRPQIRCVTSI